MSGSNPNNVPIQITTGQSAAEVEALRNRVEALNKEMTKFASVFDSMEGGEKAVAALTRSFGNLARLVSTVSSDVTVLNAAAQAANSTGRAARELNLQSQTPRQLASAAQSNDPQRVANATTITNRQINSATVQRNSVEADRNAAIDREQQARDSLRANTVKGQTALLREQASAATAEVRATTAQLRNLDALLDKANARLERLTAASIRIAEADRISQGVASRQRSVAVSAGFATTPEGQAAQAAAQRAVGARELERQGNSSLSSFSQGRAVLEQFNQGIQRRRGAFEAGNAAAQAAANQADAADQERQSADIMRRSLLAAARASSVERRASLRADSAAEAPYLAAQGRITALNDPRLQAFNEQLRQLTNQRRDTSALADLQDPVANARRVQIGVARGALGTQVGLASLGQDTSNRQDLATGRTIERLESQIVTAQNETVAALQAKLRAIQARTRSELNAAQAETKKTLTNEEVVSAAVARRTTSLQADAAVMANPTTRGLLQSNQTTRMEINLEALVKSLQDTTSDLNQLRVSAARAAQRIGQTASLQNAEDGNFNAGATRLGVARVRQRADVADAVTADPALTTRLRDQQNARRDDNLFGDGGASMLGLQARLLLHYTILNQVFAAYTAVTTAVLDFDNGLKNLQAISSSTNGEMEKLRTTIVATSLGTRFSAVEITEAATAMAQAGLGIREIDKALPSVTLLATATGTTLATAVDIATTALSVFRLRADEMPRVADQMTAALNLSKLTMEQLALGFQYVGNTAAEMGLSFAETSAALATMANQGVRSGSTLGTGFRQLLVDLQAPNENLTNRIRELGLSMADIDVRTNGVINVLENLRRAGFTSADAFATIELRAAAAFSALARGALDMTGLLSGIQGATGAAEANAIQMESLRSRFLQLQNTINAIAFAMSGPLVAGLSNLVKGISEVLAPTEGSNEKLRIFGTLLAGMAVAGTLTFLVRLASGFGAVQAAITLATAAYAGMTVSTTALGAATTVAAGSMTVLAASMRLVPFLAIAGAVAAYLLSVQEGTATTRAFGDAAETLRQRTNEATAALTEKKAALSSLDDFMNTTIQRSRTLSTDQAALNRQIEEARSRFGELSQAVYGNITSYGDLIGVLRTVRGELRAVALQAAQTNRETAQVELARVQTDLARGPSRDNTLDVLTRTGLINTSGRGMTGTQRQANQEDPTRLLSPEAQANPDVLRAFEISLRRGVISDSNEVARLRTSLNPDNPTPSGLTAEQTRGILSILSDRAVLLGQERTAQATIGSSSRAVDTLDLQGTSRFETLSGRISGVATNVSQLGDLNVGTTGLRQARLENLVNTSGEEIRAIEAEIAKFTPTEQAAFDSSDSARVLAALRGQYNTVKTALETTLRESTIRTGAATVAALTAQINEVKADENASTVPTVVAQRRETIAALTNQRRELELAAVPGRLRTELGPNAIPDELYTRTEQMRAEINAKNDREIREGQIAVSRALADTVQASFQNVVEQLRTARQQNRSGGPNGGAAAVARLETEAVRLIRERAGLRGESEAVVLRDIARIREGGNRSLASGSARAGVIEDRRETGSEQFQKATNDGLANIERDTRRDIRGTLTEGRADRARLEASRRDPSLITAGEQARLQRQIVERDISAEIAQIDIRTREITDLQREAALLVTRIAQVTEELRVANTRAGTVEGNQRISDLGQRLQGLTSSQEVIRDRITSAQTSVETGQALRDARTSRDNGNPLSQGFDGAVTQLNNTFGEEGMARGFERDFSAVFGNMRSSFGQFVTDFSSGTKTVGQAAKDMAKNIISSALQIAANRAAGQLLALGIKAAVGFVSAGAGASGPGAPTADMSIGNDFGTATPDFSYQANVYSGGVIGDDRTIQRFMRGGMVQGTHLGRDSVRAELAPGEAVLNRMAVGMVGTEAVHAMNKGLMQRSNAMPSMPAARDPDLVNVYVMDRAERPQLSAKDIVAVIGEDILTGGATRQLVKQVAMGQS